MGKLVRLGANDILEAAAEFARKSEALAASGRVLAVILTAARSLRR